MRTALLKYGAAVVMAVAVPAAFGQSGQSNQSGQSDRSNRSDQSNQSSQERSDRPGQSKERGESHQRADRSGTQAPDGYLFLEEQTVYMMANEPQQHFLQAHADLTRNDLRAAAEETRMAAAYLDMQAARDRDNNGQQDQQDLKNEANQLRQISHQLEQQHRQGQQNQQAQQNEQKGNQSEVSLQHLDRAFAKASESLAKHFDALTKSELNKQRYIAAGYDLDATANCFKNTIVWSDAKPSKDDLTMIANAQEVAANLRDSEVYQGKQALKQEQKQWKDESSKNNSNSASNTSQNQQGQERQAAAHLPAGVTNSPLTGTTPAEARNDAEHANKIADALGQAIDQYGNKIQSDNQSSGSSAANQTGSNYDHNQNQSHNQKEQSEGSQQQNQNQPKNRNR